ncbi:GMC family oxidoreductase N-terminal domain-containing protein, partial [Acinetobacter baumannii]
QEGIGLYQVTQKRGERWSAARAYLEPNRYRDTLNILTGVTVERVLMDAGRAWGVAYLQGGQQKQIRARRAVVLAGGVFGTAQVLML